jgi:hypothetical protein
MHRAAIGLRRQLTSETNEQNGHDHRQVAVEAGAHTMMAS